MRLFAMLKKEFRQIFRDFRSLFLLIFTPALLLLLFGYALNFDVKHVKTGMLDLDRTSHSRSFVNSLKSGENFDILKNFNRREEIETALDSGDVTVVFVIPSGFGKDIDSGQTASMQVLLDGSNSLMASVIQGYVKAFIQKYSIRLVSQELIRYGMKDIDMPVDMESRVFYNPDLKSSMFLIPGLIVFILMISSTISTSLSIVKERERGTIEQLLVSPLHSLHIIIGKTFPYILISLLSSAIILFVGDLVFSVHCRGSFLLLFLTATLFICSALGQGILISTITRSQQVAYQVAAFSSLLPALLLSDFVFPIRNMPVVIQAITYFVPARYFVFILRSILLKGVGIESFIMELCALAVFSILMLGIASIRMNRARLI